MDCVTGNWYCTIFMPLAALLAGVGVYASWTTLKKVWRSHTHAR